MKSLAIIPHEDDESLFLAYTLIRERPLVCVVTDSWIQHNRGDVGCSADERWEETKQACKILGCPVIRLGIRDDTITEEEVAKALRRFEGFDRVYIPAKQGGNAQHDLVSVVARRVFGEKCQEYTAYSKTELYTKGDIEVVPTEEEKELKNQALDCYKSQLNHPWVKPHFGAVKNKSEWLLEN